MYGNGASTRAFGAACDHEVLIRLAELEMRLGHREAAEAADREVEGLVEPGTSSPRAGARRTRRSRAASWRHRGGGSAGPASARGGREAGRQVARQRARQPRQHLTETGRTEEARSVLERFIREARRKRRRLVHARGRSLPRRLRVGADNSDSVALRPAVCGCVVRIGSGAVAGRSRA
jgi:hypothetical protein